jgi:hypothetical protein
VLKRFILNPFASATASVLGALMFGISWVGIDFPDGPEQQITWLVRWFTFSFVSAAISFWLQQKKIWGLESGLNPEAALTFDPDDHELHVRIGDVTVNGKPCKEYKYLIGVVNKSDVAVDGVRVALDSVSPPNVHTFYPGKPMTVFQHESPEGYFTLNRGDGRRPSQLIEVVTEYVPIGGGSGYLVMAYASEHGGSKKPFIASDRQNLQFRLEGKVPLKRIALTVKLDGLRHSVKETSTWL